MGSMPCVKSKSTLHRYKRRQEKRQNKYNFKIYYANSNGLKSKVNSLNEIVNTLDPSIICNNESNNIIYLKGYYDPIEQHRTNKNGGRIWITYKESLRNKITVLEIGDDENEQVWLNIELGSEETSLGVVYGKQETRSTVESTQNFIDKIDFYSRKAKNERKSIIVLGDYNMKVGDYFKMEITTQKGQPEKTSSK